MKQLITFTVFLLLSISYVNAQQSTPEPTPSPTSTPDPDTEARRKANEENKQSRKFEVLRNERIGSASSAKVRFYANDYLKNLYRKPTSKELKLIAPRKEDLLKYTRFLKQSNTGLIKLVNDAGCSENSKVVVVTANCLKYKFPGAGSSYSFRTKNYRLPRLADLTYSSNSFQATGNFLHGIFVNIGDIKLENISLDTNGLKFLLEYKPSTTYKNAALLDKILSKGVTHKGFIYRRALFAKENTTFVLRSVAYRGKSYRAIRNLTYNELDFDKRRDVIVAFRIIRKHKDGSISLLWKKLREQKAPKLKRENKDA